MKTFPKRRKRKYYLRLIRFIVILLISFISSFFLLRGCNVDPIFSTTDPDILIGSINNHHTDTNIEIYYPLTENQTVNLAIRNYIDSKLIYFTNNITEEAELYIDFEVFRYDKSIVSFVFNHKIITEAEGNTTSHIHTETYNLMTGKKLELKDLFLTESYLDFLSDYTYNQLKELKVYKTEAQLDALRTKTLPDSENFKHFAIDKNGLTILFDQYQAESKLETMNKCLIGWEQLTDLINESFMDTDYLPSEKDTVDSDPLPEAITSPVFDSELADSKLIALTFDDGPHPKYTPKLLDILNEQDVLATFFVVGSQIELYPDIVSRAFSEGHQIGNHTYNHIDLRSATEQQLQEEITETANQIEAIIGKKPNIMRPPFGSYNDQVLAAADAAIIMWSIDPEDWNPHYDSSHIYSQVIQQAQDGDIVLLHDIHGSTIEAIESIIISLKEEGFTFVTVEQLIEARDELKDGQVYNKVPKTE